MLKPSTVEAYTRVAEALESLGLGTHPPATSLGAVEALGKSVLDGSDRVMNPTPKGGGLKPLFMTSPRKDT
jgi:hypothetical protein